MRVYDQLVSTPAALSATICAPWDDCILDRDGPGADDCFGDKGITRGSDVGRSQRHASGPRGWLVLARGAMLVRRVG
jgi:hypothetical protein